MLDRTRLLAAVAPALISACIPAASLATEQRMRLTVEVNIEGTESVTGKGSDRTTARFREGYTLVTYLKSEGDLMQFNPKDPQYAQKMMGMATNAAGGNAEEAYTGEEEPRYMTYFGYDECGATAHVYVERTTSGTLGDVSGAVPYTVVNKADYDSNPAEIRLLCNSHQLILDTKDNSIYTDGALTPTGKGTSTSTLRGKTTESSGEATTHGEALAWVFEQLRHGPRVATRNTTIKLQQNQSAAIHSGRYAGEARIEMSWKAEDVK